MKFADKCGIIMPISKSPDGKYSEIHWTKVKTIIETIISNSGLISLPVWEDEKTQETIHSKIINNIFQIPIIICDVSSNNPNVLFELGLRFAFNKPVLIIVDNKTKINFDINGIEHNVTCPANIVSKPVNKYVFTAKAN